MKGERETVVPSVYFAVSWSIVLLFVEIPCTKQDGPKMVHQSQTCDESGFSFWFGIEHDGEDEFSTWDIGSTHKPIYFFLLSSTVQGTGLNKNTGVGNFQNHPHRSHLSLLETFILVQLICKLWATCYCGKPEKPVRHVHYHLLFKSL